MASNVDRHNTKRTQSSPEIQKHGPENRNTRRSTSKKAQHGAKRHVDVKDSTEESSSQGTTTPRNFLEVRLVYLLRGEERGGNIPEAMTLKSLRNPNHPLLMEILRRGKKQKLGYLA
jgi:hypothetical protein